MSDLHAEENKIDTFKLLIEVLIDLRSRFLWYNLRFIIVPQRLINVSLEKYEDMERQKRYYYDTKTIPTIMIPLRYHYDSCDRQETETEIQIEQPVLVEIFLPRIRYSAIGAGNCYGTKNYLSIFKNNLWLFILVVSTVINVSFFA